MTTPATTTPATTTPATNPTPDPRTAPDDKATEDAGHTPADRPVNRGVSAQEPAEGGDDAPAGTEGSPAG